MSTCRISRPLLVDAVQSAETKTIATDLGFINVRPGEWVICGEAGECYIVDDAFFRRTFVAVDGTQVSESGSPEWGCSLPGCARVTTTTRTRTSSCRGLIFRSARPSFRRGASHKRR